MAFNIGPDTTGVGSTMILTAQTEADGDGSITACGLGTCSRTVEGGWANFTGTFTWNGANGLQTIGFESLGTSFGNPSSTGNYLDDIQITLKPFIHFNGGAANVTYTEGGTAPAVAVRIVGTVTSNLTIPLTVGGTATRGTTATPGANDDYTLSAAGATITVPEGDYGDGRNINIPITFLNDAVIENDETITLTIPTGGNLPYVVANTDECTGAAIGQMTITIVDNDVNLRISKTNTPAVQPLDQATDTVTSGQNVTYTLLVENGTRAVSGAVIRDQAVSGITCPAPSPASQSVTCVASAGQACTSATYPVSTLTDTGIVLGNMPANSSVTLTFTCRVN